MSYYDDRKALLKKIQEWAYKDPKDREPWAHIVAEAGAEYGFGESVCLNVLRQNSRKKLDINDEGVLVRVDKGESRLA